MTHVRGFDLNASAYPFTVRIWRGRDPLDSPPAFETVVTGPGALKLPADELGPDIRTQVTFGDGQIQRKGDWPQPGQD